VKRPRSCDIPEDEKPATVAVPVEYVIGEHSE
jgi:hypothetical protein